MFFSKDRIGTIFLLIFCIIYGILAQQIPLLPFQAKVAFHAATMPNVLTVMGVGLSLGIIILSKSDEKPHYPGYNWLIGGYFIVLMSIYGLTVRPYGFILSTSLFLMCGFFILGERAIWKLFAVAVPIVVIFWLIMTQGLDVFIEPLPFFLKEEG